MRLIRIIFLITTLCFIPMMMTAGAHSSLAHAQTGAVITIGKNQKIVVTPARPVEDAAPPIVLYKVMGVVLFIWTGLAAYLFAIDRRVARIEKEILSRK